MTEVSTEKKVKAKKGEGPVSIGYLVGDKLSKRVADGVTAIVVTPKVGEAKNYDLTTIPQGMLLQLAGLGLGKRLDVFIRNTVKNADDANVISLADSVFNEIKEGKIYSRTEGSGGGAGRPFDYQFWVDVMANTAKSKKKTATEEQLAAFRTKLESSPPKERQVLLKKLQGDKVFSYNMKKLITEREAAKIKKDGAGDFDALSEF